MEDRFTHIIVGAGSAGCLVANRLSKKKENRVLLLESGNWDTGFWTKIPVGYFRTINNEKVTRHTLTQPSETIAGRSIDWPRGHVIGGSSSVNGLAFIRGQRENFDRWADLGLIEWGYKAVLPFFRRLENFSGPASQFHGSLGELKVSELRNHHPYCQAWIDAGLELGIPKNADFNSDQSYGLGTYHLTIGRRFRSSSATAFLRPALKRTNLVVVTGADVQKLLITEGQVTGVEFCHKRKIKNVSASSEVVLSAGAIGSPKILQLSGIGPAKLLKDLNIPVVVNRSDVGGNLQDHYQMRTIVKLSKRDSMNDHVRNPFMLASMGLNWILKGTGPLTVGAGNVGGGVRTKLSVNNQPDIQFNVMPLSADRPGEPLHKYSGFTAAAWQCHPASRGRTDIVSSDPSKDTKIQPNYLSETIDQETIVEGIKILRQIYKQPAFKDLWDSEIIPGSKYKTDAQILDAAKNMGGTVYHYAGTCRMGTDRDAVVDGQLKVNGVKNLRVVDASIMPEITSANINAPTLMIAEKASDMILNNN